MTSTQMRGIGYVKYRELAEPVLIMAAVADVLAFLNRWEVAGYITWAVFVFDLGVRLILTEDHPIRYLRKNWFDLIIASVPPIGQVGGLRGLRLLRMLLLLRMGMNFVRVMVSLKGFLKRKSIRTASLVTTMGLVIATSVVQRLEEWEFGEALWWAVVTMTTVGYGDYVPKTPGGRGLAVLLILVGIGVFGVVTANIAALFVEGERDS